MTPDSGPHFMTESTLSIESEPEPSIISQSLTLETVSNPNEKANEKPVPLKK